MTSASRVWWGIKLRPRLYFGEVKRFPYPGDIFKYFLIPWHLPLPEVLPPLQQIPYTYKIDRAKSLYNYVTDGVEGYPS